MEYMTITKIMVREIIQARIPKDRQKLIAQTLKTHFMMELILKGLFGILSSLLFSPIRLPGHQNVKKLPKEQNSNKNVSSRADKTPVVNQITIGE